MNQWNHVKDLPPRENDRYLIARGNGDVEIARLYVYPLQSQLEWFADYESERRLTDVTHWMPLPKHPANFA